MQGKRGKSKWIKEGLADGKARKYFNHGEKSRDTCISGVFSSSHGSNPPLTPQRMLAACILNVSEFQLCTLHRIGGREN